MTVTLWVVLATVIVGVVIGMPIILKIYRTYKILSLHKAAEAEVAKSQTNQPTIKN